MKKNLKKFLTATNIIIIILIVIYFLDRFIPFPEGYEGYDAWEENNYPVLNYIFGFCGGVLTNFMGFGRILTPDGEAFYRRLTCVFLHGHILHLIANVVGLYFIGNYAEKRFGWLTSYIVFFTVAFIESYITDPLFFAIAPDKKEETLSQVSMGASGGIFGLAGFTLAAIFFDIKSFRNIGKPTIIVSAIYGFLTTYVVGLGWTTVCHNVSIVLGLVLGTLIILPFFLLKKGKFSIRNTETENENTE